MSDLKRCFLPQRLRALLALVMAYGGVPVGRPRVRVELIQWGIRHGYLEAHKVSGMHPLTREGMRVILMFMPGEINYQKGAHRIEAHNQNLLRGFQFSKYDISGIGPQDFLEWAYGAGETIRNAKPKLWGVFFTKPSVEIVAEIEEDSIPMVKLRWSAKPHEGQKIKFLDQPDPFKYAPFHTVALSKSITDMGQKLLGVQGSMLKSWENSGKTK